VPDENVFIFVKFLDGAAKKMPGYKAGHFLCLADMAVAKC
jgi:hypothetical protein